MNTAMVFGVRNLPSFNNAKLKAIHYKRASAACIKSNQKPVTAELNGDIKEYESVAEASRALNIYPQTIGLRAKYNSSFGIEKFKSYRGYIFKFK